MVRVILVLFHVRFTFQRIKNQILRKENHVKRNRASGDTSIKLKI